jgi:hypothetical protein
MSIKYELRVDWVSGQRDELVLTTEDDEQFVHSILKNPAIEKVEIRKLYRTVWSVIWREEIYPPKQKAGKK